jgi:hypothetical protein
MQNTGKRFGVAGAVLLLSLFSLQAQAEIGFDSVFSDSRAAFEVASAPKPEAPSAPKLGGDAGSACEMTLCLAGLKAGSEPSECADPLRKYFNMKPKKRASFLNKCPKLSG